MKRTRDVLSLLYFKRYELDILRTTYIYIFCATSDNRYSNKIDKNSVVRRSPLKAKVCLNT